MGYQVLARKYRPRTFLELVGQEHVSKALTHALDQDRLHHAYLFTGTRGCGKTTIARILAKCLNCEQGVSSQPCGECGACREIAEGRFVDLIEVDAASRTKVEDTRELLDNVQYAPTRGRYKVYLIDEVHMLSSHSFNALLKTLEEPPPHVKFLLATTDPQKLPITVLSRCLQFNLKALPPDRIAAHLKVLLEREMIRYEEPALGLLGRAARGSMRDALSLTDQAIAFSGEQLSETAVAQMLGTVDRAHVQVLLRALAEGAPEGVLDALDQVAEHSPDEVSLLDELVTCLHRLAVAQVVPQREQDPALVHLAGRFLAEQIQLYYDVALRGRRDLADVPDPRAGLEMILLRMLAFRPDGVLAGGPPSKKPDEASPVAPVASPAPTSAPVPSAAPPAAVAAAPETGFSSLQALLDRKPPVIAPAPPIPPAPSTEDRESAGASVEAMASSGVASAPGPVAGRSESVTAPAVARESAAAVPSAATTPGPADDAPPPWLNEVPPWEDEPTAVPPAPAGGDSHSPAATRGAVSDPPAGPGVAEPVTPVAVDEPEVMAPASPAAPAHSAPVLARGEGEVEPGVATSFKSSPVPAEVLPRAQTAETRSGSFRLPSDVSPDSVPAFWAQLVWQLPIEGVLRNLALNMSLQGRQERRWTVALPSGQALLATRERLAELEQALSVHLGQSLQLEVMSRDPLDDAPHALFERRQAERLAQVRESLVTDPRIRSLVEIFDARLDEDTIVPSDD